MAGDTGSSGFPLKAAAQPAFGGGTDGFLARLSDSGTTLAYATYLGGSGTDAVVALSNAGSGEAVVAGATDSANFSVLLPFQAAAGGGVDGFAAKVPTTPAAPVNVASGAVTYLQTVITWTDPSLGRASFEIQRKAPQEEWVTVAVLPAGTTTWTDTTVVPGTYYYYRMRSILDGVASPYTTEMFVLTPSIPLPTVPGNPVLTAETPRSVRVRWEDRSDSEMTFEVFRSVDGGSYALAGSRSAGTTEWLDEGVTSDRTWSYKVRAVGVAGPSAFSGSASVATDPTMGIEILSGKRVDGARRFRDTVSLTARIESLADGSAQDIVAAGIQVGIGGEASDPILSIPAADGGWKSRRGVFTWKSPKGSISKAVVVVDTVRGTIKIKITGLELQPADAGSVRVWIRSGADAGSFRSAWTEKKAGRMAF